MKTFSIYLTENTTRTRTERLHRMLSHYGYQHDGNGNYSHSMGHTASISDDGWQQGKKKGKTPGGLDRHLTKLHQTSFDF